MDLKQMIADHIFNDKMEEKIIKALNDNINIPIIGEESVEKILRAIYNSIEEVVKKAILK